MRETTAPPVLETLILQEVAFDASPGRIYEALTVGGQFGAMTGAPAEIEGFCGGKFSLFGGRVTGRNVELISDERIVQAWRVEAWPLGVYSIVRFDLAADGQGTRVRLGHKGFPAADRDALDGNWLKMYWEPLRAYLARG